MPTLPEQPTLLEQQYDTFMKRWQALRDEAPPVRTMVLAVNLHLPRLFLMGVALNNNGARPRLTARIPYDSPYGIERDLHVTADLRGLVNFRAFGTNGRTLPWLDLDVVDTESFLDDGHIISVIGRHVLRHFPDGTMSGQEAHDLPPVDQVLLARGLSGTSFVLEHWRDKGFEVEMGAPLDTSRGELVGAR